MPFSARQGFFKTTAAGTPAYPDWPTQANVSQYNTEVALYSGTRGTFATNTFGKSYVSNSYRGSVVQQVLYQEQHIQMVTFISYQDHKVTYLNMILAVIQQHK